jgi:antitoxin (DNA-binding transcriptional repressor) of toxin-antitoxin stability system
MKFVPSRDLRLYTNKVIEDLKEEQEIIVTQNGMPVALMIPIDPKNLNETLNSWQSIKIKKAVRDLRESAVMETNISDGSNE